MSRLKKKGSVVKMRLVQSNLFTAKIEGYSEHDALIEFVEACTGKRRTIRQCAIEKSEKRELRRACFPKDGSADYFEAAYRIDYYDKPEN